MLMRLPSITLLLTLPIVFACGNQRNAASATPPAEAPTAVSPETVPVVDQSGPRFGGAAKADSLFFSLERTPCFGACRAYSIKIYRSGFATFDGRMNVDLMGAHSTRISTATMEDLLTRSEGSGFFGMNDKYDAQVTDLPSTIIRIVSNGRDKKVVARVGTPPAFKALAEYAEGQLLPLKWAPGAAKE